MPQAVPEPSQTRTDPVPDATQSELYRALARGAHASGPNGTVAFAVSTGDVDSGGGDLYVALGLGKYLQRLGWGVRLWPMSRWDEPVPASVDVVVSMIESFVPGLVPTGTGLVAWVRNWTATWAELPYLSEFDAVWCSSRASAARVGERFDGPITVLPIGTDLELFDPPRDDDPVRSLDVVTTANFWGVERSAQPAIDRLAESHRVVWYGANGEHLGHSPRVEHRGYVPFFALPDVYRSARVVVDDVIPPAREFATHNSRLFESLAAGALVVTNCAEGLDELGLGEVPVYDDGDELVRAVDASDPGLADRLRDVVRDRHSFRSRAEVADPALRDVLAARRSVAPAPDRGALLSWTTHVREHLRRAEHDRDVHFAGVHDINERLVGVLAHAERLEDELDAAHGERDRIAAQLAETLATRSWRVTAPLRSLEERIVNRSRL